MSNEDILFEYNENGAIGNVYIHGLGIDEPLALINGSVFNYYHADALDSILYVSDGQGNVIQGYLYDSYGNLLTGAIDQPYAYTGREWDKDIGLYYYRARYYDPEIGRFITQDPIGFAGGDLNLYSYVQQNPVNWIDPYGLYSLDDFLRDAGNYSAAFGDTITFGGTKWIRDQWNQTYGWDDSVDYCSGLYKGGKYSGYGWGMAFGGATAARSAGWTTRIMKHGPHHPFGPFGKLSHIQMNAWKVGAKGSGRTIFRLPLPWR